MVKVLTPISFARLKFVLEAFESNTMTVKVSQLAR